jgi:hypothetical protein
MQLRTRQEFQPDYSNVLQVLNNTGIIDEKSLPAMMTNLLRTASFGLLTLGLFRTSALADWQRDDKSLAWVRGTNAFWRFSFDLSKGKPFFHPVAPGGHMPLTNFKPADHPWHYGLWFSWKYICHPNETRHVNYWEEDSSGNAQGKTRWDPPTIETQTDGRATIRLKLRYVNPSGETEMAELRDLQVSAPAADGSFSIDWLARFTVGEKDLVLDRTPMPGEPGGQVNGGYAGLSARMVPLPVTMSVVTPAGPVGRFVSHRARPKAGAVACNFSEGPRDIGSLAFFSDPANTGGDAPWYIIDSGQMPFICQALLAPKPRSVPAHGEFSLRYHIVVSPKAWTPAALETAHKQWLSHK